MGEASFVEVTSPRHGRRPRAYISVVKGPKSCYLGMPEDQTKRQFVRIMWDRARTVRFVFNDEAGQRVSRPTQPGHQACVTIPHHIRDLFGHGQTIGDQNWLDGDTLEIRVPEREQ